MSWLRLIAAALLLTVSHFGLYGAISWSGPTTVNAGESYSIVAHDYVGYGGPPPVLSLYRNGQYLGAATAAYGHSEVAPQTGQTITYFAVNSNGSSTRQVTVVAAPISTPPIGAFDSVTSTVTQGQAAIAQGWAADNEQGSPITRVDIFLNGVDIGDATLGGSRPDVATAYGRSDYTNSGWSFSIPTGALALGNHTVEVRYVDNTGLVTVKPTKTFTVASSTPTTTSFTASSSTLPVGSAVAVTAVTTDPGSELTTHYIEYRAPGSSVWVAASPNWASPGSSYWSGGPAASHTMSATKGLPTAGNWEFRARGRDSGNRYSDYKYVTVSATAVVDSDGDGMPDWFEQLIIDFNASDAVSTSAHVAPGGDFDGDGITNLQEFLNGTSPILHDANPVSLVVF